MIVLKIDFHIDNPESYFLTKFRSNRFIFVETATKGISNLDR